MGRLIDVDNLLTAFPPEENEIFRTSAVRGTINACPTVDAVPVVRCKDCKHCQYDSIFGTYWCGGRLGGIEIEADFFCKDGEAKDGERYD